MKLRLTIAAALVAMVSNLSAANYLISNVVSGDATDVLYQNSDGSLLSGGIVALGYFAGGAPSSSIADIATTISSFTLQASSPVGGNSEDLGGSFAGYVQAASVVGPAINNGSPLLGLPMYVFVGNGATLATSTAYALARVAFIASDEPLAQTYVANPAGAVVLGDIGSLSSFTGSVTGGSATYSTLRLAVPVPEPSAALLGAIGALGLLRRRRI